MKEGGMERFIKRILLVILLLIVGLGGYFVLARMNRKESLPEGLIQANGRIEGDRVTVASKFAGRIQNLLAREGDKVMAGQTLVNLDDTQAQTRVDQAQAGLAQMQNQVAQAKQSVVVVEAQLNAARTALGTLKKEVP